MIQRLRNARERNEISRFQHSVYTALLQVPKGRVTTYQALARTLGCGSCRAVGQALRRNPFAPDVPCHRVIGSDLAIGGFMGKTGSAARLRKKQLLAAEGVLFDGDRLGDVAFLWKNGRK
jgi:methylated-DNA-[protein]-cysteine S-methyltransferase